MRFFFYWLIRAASAALSGLLALGITTALNEGIVGRFVSNSAEMVAASPDQLAAGLRTLTGLGIISGLATAALALFGWQFSKRFAFRWTSVVQTGEGDAVVHPAALHIEALSPEAREEWARTYPDKGVYGVIVLGLLVLSGALIAFGFHTLGTPGSVIAMAYLWGLISWREIAELGGSLNRVICRRTGVPAEALAWELFARDAGISQ